VTADLEIDRLLSRTETHDPAPRVSPNVSEEAERGTE